MAGKSKSKKTGKKAKTERVELTDWEFIERLLAVKENRAALAREIGVTPGRVSQRAKELADKIAQFKETGIGAPVVAIIERNIPTRKQQEEGKARANEFVRKIEEVAKQYHVFDHLEDLFRDVKSLLEDVKKEISDTKAKNKPIKPFHIEQVVKLVNQCRNLIKDAHDIKQTMAQTKNVEEFITAYARIGMQYDPELRKKLYDELANVGMEGQVALILSGG